MATTEYVDATPAELDDFAAYFATCYASRKGSAVGDQVNRESDLAELHEIALELHARWEHAQSPVAKLVHEMAATYDPAAARFAKGTAVYFGSQAWTVGYEVDGLAQITRGEVTRFVGVDDLTPVTAEDEHRAAAFAHLGRLS